MGLRDIGKLATIIGVVLSDMQPGAKAAKILLNHQEHFCKLDELHPNVNRDFIKATNYL